MTITPHLRLKPGAAFPTLAPAGFRILAHLDHCARAMNLVLTITSGSEERGRATSDPHMTGEAVDVSVLLLSIQNIRVLYDALHDGLGEAFTVLLEAPRHVVPLELVDIIYVSPKATALHLHIQRRKGTTWPPASSSAIGGQFT